jgi:hypothetical protein
MKNIFYEDLGVLKSVNDYNIQKKILKVRAFSLFHKCQYNCVENINNNDTEVCFRNCERGS